MSERPEPRPTRVRVTGPPRARRAQPDRVRDVDRQTALGGVYLRSLLREQLVLALRVLAVLALAVGGLPLLFVLAPGLAQVAVLGIPLPWLVVGVLVHPVLIGLGWWYVRVAEANERAFAELVGAGEADERPDGRRDGRGDGRRDGRGDGRGGR